MAALRFEIAMLRHARVLRHAQMLRKAGFNPDQPRDERGRWTDAGHVTGDSASDALPDSIFPLGIQIAQNEDSDRIDLLNERELGGHAIERHVGKSQEFLLNDVRSLQNSVIEREDFAGGLRTGSFTSLEAANKLVSSTLAQNPALVDKVASGVSPRENLNARFESPTGYEAYAATERSQAYIRQTYGVRVTIVPDPRVSKGYRVDTAFPVNMDR